MKSKYTLLLIPPNNAPARQIQISLKGKRILISGLATLGVLIIFLFSYNIYLSHTLRIQEADFKAAEQMKLANQEKDQEIERLQSESLKATQELASIYELELKLASILKVDPSATQTSRGSAPPSVLGTHSDGAVSLTNQLTLLKQYYNLAIEKKDQINHTPSILPVEGEIASSFGYRQNPFGKRTDEFHNGVDIAVNYGTPVHATAAGTVTFAGWDSVYGRKVEIDHGNGIVTFYGHNSRLNVNAGDTVQKGDIIAYSGNSGRSTGAHLHYGALDQGKSIDPLTFTNFTKEQ
ncbi:M23 family metallopeptidase [Desulfitobacterium sp. AusDCA]|uniref:M23 family metallopeptidase n=1 Tax=Desulfitobacterium sp. AusDCA TaxID=3240383 RepID=UPI003DA751EC